jgi:hypothetical protein
VENTAPVPIPKPFTPHPSFSDEVNRNIVQLEVETQHHWYTIVVRGRGQELISGHPQYFPGPVAVRIAGSTWGGSMLKLRFVGRGMHLEFLHPVYQTITTSRILEIRASDQLAGNARAPQN